MALAGIGREYQRFHKASIAQASWIRLCVSNRLGIRTLYDGDSFTMYSKHPMI
ncbi:hypothetical protein AGMMS49992_05340 [Clostridia bacterium]|nr:hypothetical protein AGMMS49992_05340 [Clostridia bacterium]